MDSPYGGGGPRQPPNQAPNPSLTSVETVDVVLDDARMYTVEWRDDATFGFTVTPVNSDRGTVLLLARRTARPAQLEAAGLSRVVPGDMLVAIGDEQVYHLGAENATKYMRCVRKPVRLTLQLSPYGSSGTQLPDLAPNEYNYRWESGPLGISLTEDPQSHLPMVKRLSDKATEFVRTQVELGDQLVYANDVATCEYSIHDFMGVLRNMPKPILLRFRKPLKDADLVELPELGPDEYEFLWEYGPLGLVVGMSRAGYPFVRSFTGKGTSRQLGLVQENDEITMVNDLSTVEIGFTETMHYLMNVPKPAVLRFRRKPLTASPRRERQPTERRATVPARPPTQEYSTMGPTNGNGPTRGAAMSVASEVPNYLYGNANANRPEYRRVETPPMKGTASDRSSDQARQSGEISMGNVRQMSTGGSSVGSGDGMVDLAGLNINTPPAVVTSPQSATAATQSTWTRGNSGGSNRVTSPASGSAQRSNSNASNQMYSGNSFEDTTTTMPRTLSADSAPRPTSPETPTMTMPPPIITSTSQLQPSMTTNATSPVKRASMVSNEPVFGIDESAYFQVQWTDGPFGSTVREADSTAGAVMLITKRTNKKTCVGLRRIAVGDILVRIGDKDVWDMGFERATRYLRKVPKPVVLTFQAID